MTSKSITSIHLNSKKNKVVIVELKKGPMIYNISTNNTFDNEKRILTPKQLKNEIRILDAQWSEPLKEQDTEDSKIVEYILFSSANKTISLWNYDTRKVDIVYEFRTSKALKLEWNKYKGMTKYFISGHENGSCRYWDKDNPTPLLEFHFSNQISSVKNVAINPILGSTFACGHEDGKMFIWQIGSEKKPELYFQVDGQAFEGLEWHPTDPNIMI